MKKCKICCERTEVRVIGTDLIFVNGISMPPEDFNKILQEAPKVNVFDAKAESIKPCIASKGYDLDEY